MGIAYAFSLFPNCEGVEVYYLTEKQESEVYMDSEEQELQQLTNNNHNPKYTYQITISDNNPEHWDKLITLARTNYSFWAYIIHDKDRNEDGTLKKPHLHLVCKNKTSTSLKAHCGIFADVVPSNFVCKARSIRGISRYLTHIDYPSKCQYSLDDVKTNNRAYLLEQYEDANATQEYKDFKSILEGRMSLDEFIKKHEAQFAHLNLYQKVALFNTIIRSSREQNERN